MMNHLQSDGVVEEWQDDIVVEGWCGVRMGK